MAMMKKVKPRGAPHVHRKESEIENHLGSIKKVLFIVRSIINLSKQAVAEDD